MHIIEAGEPEWSAERAHFDRRVAAVVRALDGLDRPAIDDVLERAGSIAREKARR